MNELVKTLATEFRDKEYAHSYLEDYSNMEIAAQIKVLREQRGLTQKELAELAGMKQERISKLEDVNYDAWSVKTLRKLARAFDISLKVSFESISSRIADIDKLNQKELERVSRIDDLNIFGCYHHDNGAIPGRTVITASHVRMKSVPANDDWHSCEPVMTCN
jgi:transcriptional regulator with XRE-family HTH domain